ncbi:heme lyase CcmF/NrfE family subunit [Kordiimonas lacus]|uniref:Cytochrome c-type biogenesis protein CcmF n=1 Tax=Kordiimonas lacus TaxID=637679 RepID=A0A1G6U2P7_9PROT|nr:heme lyase CcmF/NrfE family subunit [Kordiimonas lacus]SDD34815.1 cytochrome c-type biogenesis protein CcmF [Kordiimonas lacus]
MIAELGHFATILALVLALLGATVPHVGIARGDSRLMAVADNAAIGQFLMAIIAFGALMYSYIISDFSVYAVAANSHSAKPMLYKIAGVWGNHEGSLLLWILMLTLFAAALSLKGRKLPQRFRTRVIAVQSALVVGFLLFILFTSNPFVRLDPAPFEGNGLNPLLQDPGLAFHPPMLYLGYVGLSVAFSFAVAALIEGEVTPLWARWVRPWTLVAWMFLTAGIILGSWWAYYELGWGGWWFWDPAENASFMPWLVATALLHSAIVVEKRDALKSWTILLSIVAFSFSLLGTFLVRSGVITSVHAFANDPARGVFILGFLVVVIGGALTLYAWRAPKLTPGGLFGLVSRESALVLNNILLSTFAGVVLVGTLYPLVLEATGSGQISVGAPFFDFGAIVLMSPLIVALGFGPLLAWKRGRLPRAATTLLPALVVALVVGLFTYWQTAGGVVMTAFGLLLATWLLASVAMEIAERTQLFKNPAGFLRRLRHLPRASWGMSLAHSGVAVLLFGITISEAWTEEKLVIMQRGDTAEVGDYSVRFDGVAPVTGPNYTAIQGHFYASPKSGGADIMLEPQDRLYTDPVMNTTEAAIHSMLSGDLYAVIGEAAGGGRWSVRLYFKPFVVGLWLGAAMMVLGGLLSLSDRRLRVGAPKAKKLSAEA